MERVKKFTYNIKEGKTNYMKITNTRSTAEDLSLEVKNGTIKEIEKYKYLGDVYSSQGDNKVKINGRMEKLMFMANKVKRQGHFEKVGKGDTQVRKTLIETTIIPSVLANTETWTSITDVEFRALDQAHYKMMRVVYEIQRGTSYLGMLNECGPSHI